MEYGYKNMDIASRFQIFHIVCKHKYKYKYKVEGISHKHSPLSLMTCVFLSNTFKSLTTNDWMTWIPFLEIMHDFL